MSKTLQVLCGISCAACLMFPMTAFGDDYGSKQAEAEAALQSLNVMMENFQILTQEYDEAMYESQIAEEEVEKAQQNIDQKTEEIEEYTNRLSNRIVDIYRGLDTSFLNIVLDSSSFEEFANNIYLFDAIQKNDAELIINTKQAKKELEESKRVKEEQSALARQKVEEAKAAKDSIDVQIQEVQALYDSLSAEAAEILANNSAAIADSGTDVVEETIESSQIVSYDEGSGTATLADGSTATVVGYDGNGNAIVQRAYAALGSNYVWGGVGGSAGGYDCSGLVSYALTGTNNRVGTTGTFMGWNEVSNPQPGDVCTSAGHCGIYIGNGQMIHAADYGIGVIVGPVQSDMKFVTPN